MPSSIDRSAPPENASLPEVTTTPLTAASAEVCFTISASSVMVVSSSTFIERPGMSHVTSAMPPASVSTLKFLKAICCSLDADTPWARRLSLIVGWAKAKRAHQSRLEEDGGHGAKGAFARPTSSNPLDDGRGAHAAADAQRHQRGRLVGALEFVEHGAQDHRAGRAKRMAKRDRAAVDVDLGIVDVEG